MGSEPLTVATRVTSSPNITVMFDSLFTNDGGSEERKNAEMESQQGDKVIRKSNIYV